MPLAEGDVCAAALDDQFLEKRVLKKHGLQLDLAVLEQLASGLIGDDLEELLFELSEVVREGVDSEGGERSRGLDSGE